MAATQQCGFVAADGDIELQGEHNLDFMFDICDEITVLDTGRMVATGQLTEIFSQAEVVRAYISDATSSRRDPNAIA